MMRARSIAMPSDMAAARARATMPGSAVLQAWQAAGGHAVHAAADSAAGLKGPGPTWGGIEWNEWVRGGAAGGVGVNEKSARAVAAVVACTNLIGGSISICPLHFYRSAEGGRERIKSDLWWLFNERMHRDWSAAAGWQFLSDSKLFHGDAIARIRRVSRFDSRVESIEPWHPLLVDVEIKAGRRLYTFWSDDRSQAEVVEADDVLHIPGAGFNGLRGLSQLRYGLRYPAGIAAAADSQSAQFWADGARPDFAIEVPGAMGDDARDTLRKSWMERHSGQGSKKAPVVLTNGMKLHQLTMSAEDAQLISVRSFQIEEVCRIFGVPPFMVGHTTNTTSWGSGIEQMSIGFVKYTLSRHLKAFEQEINHKFFATARNSAEFLTAGLERGDIKTRFEAYRIAIGRAGERGWTLPSEVRALENMPDAPGIDERVNPGSSAPASNPANPADPAKETP